MRFLCVMDQAEVPYLVCSRRVASMVTHWVSGRSVPCVKRYDVHGKPLDDDVYCPNCTPEISRRWVGYLHVVNARNGQQFFLTLPPGAGFNLIDPLPDDYNLRGRKLYVRRETASPQSALLVRLDPTFLNAESLPAEKAPEEYLVTLFKRVEHLTKPRS